MPPLAGAGAALGGLLSSAGGGSALLGGLNIAGAGAGLFNALRGGGGAGQAGSLSPLNPAQFTLNQLLGTKLVRHGHGADAGTTSLVRDRKNPGLFGGPDFFNAVQDFAFNPLQPSQGEQDFINSLISSAPGRLDSILGDLTSLRQRTEGSFAGARSALENLVNTGFRTDASPIFDTAISGFNRNILPGIAERVGAFGGGLQSSGFRNTAAREAANLLDEAARVNVGLEENANARRAGAVPLLGALAGQESGVLASLLGTEAALPIGFGQDVLNLGTGLRNTIEAGRARPLDVFSLLAGLGGPGTSQFQQTGFSPQGSGTADILSALTSNAGGIAEILKGLGGLGGLFGGGFNQPGTSPVSIAI